MLVRSLTLVLPLLARLTVCTQLRSATSAFSTSSASCASSSTTAAAMATMKAVRVNAFGGPEVLQVEDVPIPTPAADQVLVKIMAAGVNPIETYIRAGNRPGVVKLPYTPGHDAAGIVVKTGEAVKNVKEGDRVYVTGSATGTYAQYCLTAGGSAHVMPDNVTFEQGAAVNTPYRTAYRALFTAARATYGQTVLIHGATGGVGVAAVQLALAAGLQVFGTAGTDEGLEAVRKEGVQHVFNHRDPKHFDEILAATGGAGVNIILEMAAHTNLGNDLPILSRGGIVVVIGNRGPVQVDARNLMSRDAWVTGIALESVTLGGPDTVALSSGLRTGKIKPLVGNVYPLAQAKEAHVDVIEHATGSAGKIVIQPWA
eukprot:m.127474 g.127474  ORF g.127474 m.127474 type:complete len:371 (-) comp16366_c1_seq1:70-1182(-)